MRPIHVALAVLINLVWGASFSAARIGLAELPPMFFTGLRFLLAAILLSFALRPLWGQMRAVVMVALTMGALHFTFLYLGLKAAGGVSAVAVAIQLIAPFSLLMAVFVLKERTSAGRLVGAAIAFGGVVLLGFDPVVFDQIAGVLLAVVAAFFAALGLALMRRMRPVGVFALQAWTGAISAPILFAVSLALEDGQLDGMRTLSAQAVGALAFVVVLTTVIGHGGWYYLLRLYPLSTLVPYGLLAPVFGVAFGVALYDEPISARFLMGAAMTIGGVAVTHLAPRATPA